MLLSRATRLLAALLSLSTITISQAYLPSTSISSFHKIHKIHKSASRPASSSFLPSSATNTRTEDADAFSAFADSLDEEPPVFKETPWQAKLDDLLNPSTNLADRQILVSELLMSNADIQQSVMEALANRKIDPLLTPTAKKYQDGTRAVARQVANDILPNLSRTPPQPPTSASLEKVGTQLFNAFASNFQQGLQDLQSDLSDPLNRIPQRLSKQQKQAQDMLKEARNIFLETPEGLEGPPYQVVETTDQYEIREYPGYMVASTIMEEGSDGAAFNTLAMYLFGGNDQAKPMAMTTPVTTTSAGEMRFYLLNAETATDMPQPLENTNVQLEEIPPARLAVRQFTGFCTDGEIARQKEILLLNLDFDGVGLDVAHGTKVPHVIFQYNPPYTLPMVRRNELAVPVVAYSMGRTMKEEWSVEDNDSNNDELSSWSSSEEPPVNSASAEVPLTTTTTTTPPMEQQGQDDVSPSDY